MADESVTATELPPVTFGPRTNGMVLLLQQAWIDGENEVVEFSLTCGAGLGSPLLHLRVEEKGTGKVRYETVDIREGLTAWVNDARERMMAEATDQTPA